MAKPLRRDAPLLAVAALLLALALPPGAHGAPGGLTGTATWYKYHSGQAAAGPGLREWLGAGWRGVRVRVCREACIDVILTDWCECPEGRIIDLDNDDFARLAPTSAGTITVTVFAGAVPPPTAPSPAPLPDTASEACPTCQTDIDSGPAAWFTGDRRPWRAV